MSSLAHLSSALGARYRVERELGRGGMATVFLAHDSKHRRRVAVKVLHPELAASVGTARFLAEIRIAAGLNHPHIVPLYDSGETDGRLYYVMPYVEGESLRARLERDGALPIDEAVRTAREVADALSHAHELGIVHRDIKPGNILLSGGHAVLADFGIARAILEGGDGKLTETGFAVGTPTYMSPEQATDLRRVDGRSDIYALGCVLYEMLAGTPPYSGPPRAVIARKIAEPLPRVSGLRDTVPRRLDDLVERATAKVPADRFPTALAVMEALDALGKPSPAARGDGLASIAVLPFVNRSADPENEYFGDGVAEELISVLAQVPGLRVAARTSSFAFRDRNVHARTIAGQLGVGALLEGSVRRAGDRVRVTALLVSADDGYHMWSESYDRRIEDVFAIQDEIAGAIAATLKVKLLGDRSVARRHSEDSEAYHYFLKGRHLWNQDNTNAARALELFERAVERDPEYALAYAGIADCHCTIGIFQQGPQQPIRERGIAAARKAMELDDGIPEVRFSAGYVKFYMEWNWPEAEREFRHAIELNPNYEQPLLFLGLLMAAQGRFEEAEEWAARGREADPVSGFAHYIASMPAYFAAEWDRAIPGFREAIDLNPGLANPLWNLSLSLSFAGFHDEAMAMGERLATVSQRAPPFLGTLGAIYVMAGRDEDARAIEAELKDRRPSEYVTPYVLGILVAWLGKTDEAFQLLEEAYEEHNILLWILAVDPTSAPLREDPRVRQLIEKMGLE